MPDKYADFTERYLKAWKEESLSDMSLASLSSEKFSPGRMVRFKNFTGPVFQLDYKAEGRWYSRTHELIGIEDDLELVAYEDWSQSKPANLGYHVAEIPRGTYGEISKIVEEALEVQDAAKQGVRVMVVVELSDLVGAIKGYLNKHVPGMKLDDLEAMADVTHRAFESGARKEK